MKISITLERYEQAVKYYQLWEKAIEPDFQMLLLYSKLLIKSKKFNLSLKTLQNAEKIASSKEKNDAIISLVELYTSSHQLQKSAKLIKRINPDALSPEQKAEFYLQKANFHYTSKEYNEATESLKLGEKIAQKNSLLFELGRIYKVMADTYNMQNLVEKATRYYKEGAMISEEEGDLLNLANVFSHWGFLELKKGKLQSAIGKLKKALHYFQLLNYPRGIAEVHLNLALTKYKLGEFRKSEKHFQEALKEARRLKETKLVGEILRRYSFLKLKISHPAVFLNFLQKNYTEFSSARAISLPAASLWQAGVSRGKEGKITEINSFLKNYIFYLVEIGKEKSIESILKQIETQKVNYSLEQEFILQVQGWIKRSKGDLKSAVALFKRAATIAKTNQNEYALMINYFNVSETYFINGNIGQAPCNTPAGSYYIGQAEIYCDLAASLAIKNQFARWQNFARIMQSKIFLKKPQIKLRVVLRNLLFAEKVAKEMKDWSLICQSQFYIMLIYRTLHLHKLEQLYRKKYVNRIAILTKGLNKTDQEFLKDKFNYSFWKSGKNIKEFITLRPHISALKLQHQFFDLLQLTSGEQIKSSLKKYMKEILGIEKFAIMLAEAQKDEEEYWLNCGFSTKGGVIGNKDVLNSKHQPYFEKAIGKKKIQYYKIGKINYCIVPLLLKQEIIGTIILSDDGELPFTKSEKLIIKLFGFYLTVILKKVGEYQAVLEQREHFSQLLAISRDILQIMNLSELENQIVLNALQLSGAERGFFITLDESNNFVFNTAFMKSGEKIDKNNLKISKTVLKDVYETGIAISTIDAIEEAKFFDSNSINSYDLHSIYCAPIRVHNSVFGFLYLDNLGSKQKVLHFNEKLLELFLLAAETAIKNSLDYQKLCIANEELLKLDQERADFINISSHEFNTPIQTLRGYLNILKDEKISTNIKANTIKIMERNISRLIQAISNVIQVNALEKSGAKVTRELINISDILKIVYDETKVFSDRRKQKLVLKIAKDIKQVYAERICLINAMKNLVLNAIKFTEDYGQIIIGARKPKFKNEEINGRETVIIYVKDNGIGIASYELENIFKEFYEIADIKAHHSGLIEFKSSGLGLGLPVTKSIVELFGGKIWAESVKGEGSTFFIALPVSYEETPEAK
jgi:signal transduction histidine kinase/Tfp pilus assembly protein PilF